MIICIHHDYGHMTYVTGQLPAVFEETVTVKKEAMHQF